MIDSQRSLENFPQLLFPPDPPPPPKLINYIFLFHFHYRTAENLVAVRVGISGQLICKLDGRQAKLGGS